MIYFAKISKKDKMEVIAKDSKAELLNYIEKWYNTWHDDYEPLNIEEDEIEYEK